MKRSEQTRLGSGRLNLWITVAATAIATLLIVAATPAQAQTYTVIHSFTGSDGGNPAAGLTLDHAGNLYGTTTDGGNGCTDYGCGTVFKLAHAGSGWVLNLLYKFSGSDGLYPEARVVFGQDGALYGTTTAGGFSNGGTVFNLRPPATVCRSFSCPWTETLLFQFNSQDNSGTGTTPLGDLTFDAAGNLYGTATNGGLFDNCTGTGCGVVYELTPSGGAWTQNIIYNFTGGSDGGHPHGGVIFDHAGNLFGTAFLDNYQDHADGLIFEFSPSGSGWTETALYHFQGGNDGGNPVGGVIFDSAGNLYGATRGGGASDGGTVFRLTPSGRQWNFGLLYSLSGIAGALGPQADLVMDSVGNLYGTTTDNGAYGYGSVFKLTPSNGGWSYTSLHDFTYGSDGAYPYYGSLVMDASGNLYGTAYAGGNSGSQCTETCGVIFEITP